jgi:hypothetical protein
MIFNLNGKPATETVVEAQAEPVGSTAVETLEVLEGPAIFQEQADEEVPDLVDAPDETDDGDEDDDESVTEEMEP